LYLYFKQEVIMKSILPFFIGVFISFSLTCQTTISSGIVSGTWTKAGSPYLIEGEIVIENGDSLRIEPGVRIEFQGSYKFKIQGQIIAIGNATDSIVLTAANSSNGWQSIRFLETPSSNDTSRFEYCVFEYGQVYDVWPENSGGAIGVKDFSKIIIDHCLFENNKAIIENPVGGLPGGGAIALWRSDPIISNSKFISNEAHYAGAISCYKHANPLIENNVFLWNVAHNFGGAIQCYKHSNPDIINNTFAFNFAYVVGGAITCYDSCSPLIDNNLMYNNSATEDGGAIELIWVCSPKIINNTIANNSANSHGGAIDISGESKPEIINTILWGNSSPEGNQIYFWDDTSLVNFYYCNIQEGQNGFAGLYNPGEYIGCIDDDPLFEDPENGHFCLTANSPCMDAGDPGMFDPDGTRIDIGACYFNQSLQTPEAFDATNIGSNGFTGNWSSCSGAIEYRLDVAFDKAFTNFIGEYEDYHVAGTSYDVEVEEAEVCYFRVRSYNDNFTSPNSNIIEVQFVGLKEHPETIPILIIPARQGIRIEIIERAFLDSSLYIYNLKGQTLMARQLNYESNYIPIESRDQVLILKVQSGKRSYSEKLMLR